MQRPIISSYSTPAEYIRDMIRFRKDSDTAFSVLRATRSLRRVSPALVSLVMQGRRNLTLDRVDEFARLLDLNATEKFFFRHWVGGMEGKDFIESHARAPRSRKEASTSILNDWINLYVKDLFLIPAVQNDPGLVDKLLLPVATPVRIKKAMDFLLREGHLRRTLNGGVVIDTTLSVTDPGVPSRKIRQFHKGALNLARQAIDLYSTDERFANTFLIALDEKRHAQLRQLLKDFAAQLQDFAAQDTPAATRLYQVLVNLSPVGGKLE